MEKTGTPSDSQTKNIPPTKEEPICAPLVLPPPPDGGWGWVICFACFMCNFIASKSEIVLRKLVYALVSK